METLQIQIITSSSVLQELINNSIQVAFDRLGVPTQGTNTDEPVSTKEICSFLNITEPTLIHWRNKGKIPFLKIGSRILYQKSAVITALEQTKSKIK